MGRGGFRLSDTIASARVLSSERGFTPGSITIDVILPLSRRLSWAWDVVKMMGSRLVLWVRQVSLHLEITDNTIHVLLEGKAYLLLDPHCFLVLLIEHLCVSRLGPNLVVSCVHFGIHLYSLEYTLRSNFLFRQRKAFS